MDLQEILNSKYYMIKVVIIYFVSLDGESIQHL